MIITTNITIDFQKQTHTPTVSAVQGDQNTRCLAVALCADGIPWTVPAGTAVAMRYCKPDGTRGHYDTMPDGCAAWSIQDNVISIFLAPQMLTVPGVVAAQLELIRDDSTLGTFSILVSVAADPAAGVTTSEDYLNWLQWLNNELDAYVRKVRENGEVLGGTMVGPIHMNGQQITGLNAPAADSEPATKKYTDDAIAGFYSLPETTAANNGQILTVVSGRAAWQSFEIWEGGSY